MKYKPDMRLIASYRPNRINNDLDHDNLELIGTTIISKDSTSIADVCFQPANPKDITKTDPMIIIITKHPSDIKTHLCICYSDKSLNQIAKDYPNGAAARACEMWNQYHVEIRDELNREND